MKETKKLYDSISNLDDRFVLEAQAEQARKAPVWRKWAGLAACLCLAAVSVTAALHPWEPDGTPFSNPTETIDRGTEPTGAPSTDIPPVQPNGDDRPGIAPLEPPDAPTVAVNWDGVAVNESEGLSAGEAMLCLDPENYSFEFWGQEDVAAYYGWTLAPAYIPEGLTGGGQGAFAEIWRARATGEIVLDQARRGFWTAFGEDGTPRSDDGPDAPAGFTVRASRGGDFLCALLPVDNARTTDFGGVSVTLSHFSVQHGHNDPDAYDIYTAFFALNGVEYEIEARRLALEEVIKIAASVINLPDSQDFIVGGPGPLSGDPAVSHGSENTIFITGLSRGGPGEFAGDMHRPEGFHKNIGSALALKMSITDDASFQYSVLIRIPEGTTLEQTLSRANENLNMTINPDDAVAVNISDDFDTAGRYYYRLTAGQIVALAESGAWCLYIGSGQGNYKDINWDTRDGIDAFCELEGDMYVWAGGGIEAHPDIGVEE